MLDRYGLTDGLKPMGADLRGPCPVHGGSNPTQFSADPERNCWQCFTCGAGGTILDLVAALEGVGLHEAGLLILEWFGDGDPPPVPTGVGRPSPARAKGAPGPPAPLAFRLTLDPDHPYLAARGLTAEPSIPSSTRPPHPFPQTRILATTPSTPPTTSSPSTISPPSRPSASSSFPHSS